MVGGEYVIWGLTHRRDADKYGGMKSLHDQFVNEVESFLSKTEMLPTLFGRAALGDGNFVTTLRRGRSPSARTIDKVRAYMHAERPDILKNGRAR